MKPIDKVNNAIAGKGKNNIPVVLWVNSPFLMRYVNIKAKQYYLNSENKLNSYIKFQKDFPEVIMAGIFSDFGSVVMPSAFGGKIIWMENDAPYIQPAIKKNEEILNIKSLNPIKSELMVHSLNEYRYIWENIDIKYIEEYGYLRNMALSLGPLETAGLVMGYEKFFIGFYDIPKLIHKLLEIITEGIIKWIKKQEEINGKIERLYLPDHVPTQLSPKLFMEFGMPYFKQIFDEFKGCTIIWHNEGEINHLIEYIKQLPIDVYHFGEDLKLLKDKLGAEICLMGNVPPIKVLYSMSMEEIKKDCLRRLKMGAHDGKFLLSTGGGLCPGTPKANIRVLIEAAEIYNKNT